MTFPRIYKYKECKILLQSEKNYTITFATRASHTRYHIPKLHHTHTHTHQHIHTYAHTHTHTHTHTHVHLNTHLHTHLLASMQEPTFRTLHHSTHLPVTFPLFLKVTMFSVCPVLISQSLSVCFLPVSQSLG